MNESLKIEELINDVELLKTVVSVLVAGSGDQVNEHLLRLLKDGTDAKERLVNLLDLSR